MGSRFLPQGIFSTQTLEVCSHKYLIWKFYHIKKKSTDSHCTLHLTDSAWQPLIYYLLHQFSSVQSLSRVQLFATPWTAACQTSLSITSSWSLPKPMSIELVMPSNHFFLCHPLLLLPSIFPSTRVFSNESTLRIRWPKYWSFSFNINLSNEHPRLISFRMDWLDLLAVQGTLKSLLQHCSQRHQFFIAQLSL